MTSAHITMKWPVRFHHRAIALLVLSIIFFHLNILTLLPSTHWWRRRRRRGSQRSKWEIISSIWGVHLWCNTGLLLWLLLLHPWWTDGRYRWCWHLLVPWKWWSIGCHVHQLTWCRRAWHWGCRHVSTYNNPFKYLHNTMSSWICTSTSDQKWTEGGGRKYRYFGQTSFMNNPTRKM